MIAMSYNLQANHIQHYPIGGENALRLIYKKRTSRIEGVYKDTVLIYDCNDVDDEADIKDIKPLLRLMSDLYKERNEKIDIVELAKIAYPHYDWDFDDESDKAFSLGTMEFDLYFYFEDGSFYCGDWNGRTKTVHNQLALFQYLFENHYDVFSLIEKELAIDTNTVEI